MTANLRARAIATSFAIAAFASAAGCAGGASRAGGAKSAEPARAGTSAAAHGQHTADAQPATPSRATGKHAPLKYELRGKRFPLPLVHGTVAGEPTWMLVDTGANSHVVAGWFARKVGLKLEKLGDLGADHAGRSIATFRVEHPRVSIDGWGELADGPMLATEVPELIEQLGIGAFVSPQSLLAKDDGAIVLDFLSSEIREDTFDAAVHKLGTRGSSLAPNGGRACTDDASAIKGLAYVLPAKVEGRDVDLMLDTGALRSDLLAQSHAGRALAPKSIANKEQLYAASGKMTSRTVKGAAVVVGEFEVRTDVDLIPGVDDPYCPRDGVVSMDLLRACVLVLGKGGMSGRCGGRY